MNVYTVKIYRMRKKNFNGSFISVFLLLRLHSCLMITLNKNFDAVVLLRQKENKTLGSSTISLNFSIVASHSGWVN